jgi:chorismate-pyruvate lyase
MIERLLVLALAAGALARAQEAPSWPDTYVARLEALALLQTLNADVLASRSATATLEAWCRDHRLALEPTIKAEVVKGAGKAIAPEQRERLQVGPEEIVKYRRVRLRCGERALSEADNWYVPSRLTAEMNRLLETTDTPFGRAVQGLAPYRRTVAVKRLWSPLPEGWERGVRVVDGSGALAIPEGLFEHRAVLYTREHRPFSEVVEVYRREVLGAGR